MRVRVMVRVRVEEAPIGSRSPGWAAERRYQE
jgi:hypothetical protein